MMEAKIEPFELVWTKAQIMNEKQPLKQILFEFLLTMYCTNVPD